MVIKIENDFEKPLLDIIKNKYPYLYEMLYKKVAYLDFKSSYIRFTNGDAEVSIYTNNSNDYLGTFSFKFKEKHNKYGKYYSNYIIEPNLKFRVEI